MKLIPFILALVLCGCCNVMAHRNGVAFPFSGSVYCTEAMPDTLSVCAFLPFELVADVVTLPYDLILKLR